MGIKSPDFWGAFACARCHDLLDGRQSGLTRDEKNEAWLSAIFETQHQLFQEGILKEG